MSQKPWFVGVRIFVISFLSFLGFFSACGPSVTVCKDDFDCKNGFYCGETSTGQKICIKKQIKDSGNTPDQPATNTNTTGCKNDSDCRGTTFCNNGVCKTRNNTNTNNTNTNNTPPGSCKIPSYSPGSVKPNNGQQVPLDNLDKAFFRELARIYYVSQSCHNQIWGGQYQMHRIPTYLVNIGAATPGTSSGKKGFIINHPSPPAGSKLIDSKLTYGIPNVYQFDGAAKSITQPGFDFGLKVGNTNVYAFEYSSGDAFTNPTAKSQTTGKVTDVFAFFVHEAFHRVQDYEEKWKYPPGNQDSSGYPVTEELTGLAILLGAVLIDGFVGGIPAEQALKMYYAIRKQRIEKDTSSTKLITNLDNFQEWLEGMAMYAEHKYLSVLGLQYPNKDPNSIPGRIVYFTTLRASDSKNDVIDTFAARYYATGAAVGLMLDKVGDRTWKTRIRQGQTPYAIVAAKYSSLSNSQLAQLVQQAKQKYDYNGKILPIAKSYASKK